MAKRRPLHRYQLVGRIGRKQVGRVITARNLQDAVNKAAKIFPKGLITVTRVTSRSGREFETTIVDR